MPFGEVPSLPVVALIAAVAWGILLCRLHRRGELSLLQAPVPVCVCIYDAGVMADTIFCRTTCTSRGGIPPYPLSISMTPFVGSELFDAIQNAVVSSLWASSYP